tara:strand:- start:115 stop:357 length:243 start_codon:yes stop_codon:yes gene_type:complete
MLNMNEIQYKDVLDIEWELRRAELRAKTEWDETLRWGKEDNLLYELAHEKVKALRDAQKKMRAIYKVIRDHSDIEVKHCA